MTKAPEHLSRDLPEARYWHKTSCSTCCRRFHTSMWDLHPAWLHLHHAPARALSIQSIQSSKQRPVKSDHALVGLARIYAQKHLRKLIFTTTHMIARSHPSCVGEANPQHRGESGKRTYRITARRLISGES